MYYCFMLKVEKGRLLEANILHFRIEYGLLLYVGKTIDNGLKKERIVV